MTLYDLHIKMLHNIVCSLFSMNEVYLKHTLGSNWDSTSVLMGTQHVKKSFFLTSLDFEDIEPGQQKFMKLQTDLVPIRVTGIFTALLTFRDLKEGGVTLGPPPVLNAKTYPVHIL